MMKKWYVANCSELKSPISFLPTAPYKSAFNAATPLPALSSILRTQVL
jgi:hypothetical protein